MASFINTNLSSLNAQRNLTMSQSSLATSLQRLSSGLAISDRMTSQIRGSDQAARNANDGISLAQTAEGDLSNISDNLQRIRELAVQSSNASNSASDRNALNNEATQLVAEINRIATTSSFNGVKLLDGSFNAQTFQVGANNTANDRITVASISSAQTNALGVGSGSSYSSTTAAASATTNALAAGNVTINGYTVGAAITDGVSFAQGANSAIAKATAINAITGSTGVTASVSSTAVAGTTVTTSGAIAAGDVLINGVDIGAIAAATTSAATRGSDIAAAVNKISNQTGVTATFNTTTGAVALSAADGRNITVTNSTNAAATAANTGLGTAASGTTSTSTANISLSSSSSAGITIGGGANAGNAGLTTGYTAATATAGAGVSSLNLSTAAGAQAALATIDAALTTVSDSRSALGAYQNRFASVVTSLQTTSENLSASRSRITDTDFASETAKLSRGQILQQAGTAMLAQANSLPNGVLALLRG